MKPANAPEEPELQAYPCIVQLFGQLGAGIAYETLCCNRGCAKTCAFLVCMYTLQAVVEASRCCEHAFDCTPDEVAQIIYVRLSIITKPALTGKTHIRWLSDFNSG